MGEEDGVSASQSVVRQYLGQNGRAHPMFLANESRDKSADQQTADWERRSKRQNVPARRPRGDA